MADGVGTTSLVSEDLLPDPGAKGDMTLEGIDSDRDGVRDDVQRWLALAYPDSQKIRALVTQYVKAVQLFILSSNNKELAIQYATESNRALYCAFYIDSKAYRSLDEALAKVLNTQLRSKSYMEANRQLSGRFFSTPKNLKTGCNFDPDAMPN